MAKQAGAAPGVVITTVSARHLDAGMVTAAPVRNRRGQKILPADRELDASDLERIRAHNIRQVKIKRQ